MQDRIGFDKVTALANGNYVIASSVWDNGARANAGALTWADGTTGRSGVVSASNSLVGTSTDDRVGYDAAAAGVVALDNGDYVLRSSEWSAPGIAGAGAVTLASGSVGLSGFIAPGNSVQGTAIEHGDDLTFDYDLVRERLIVGRPDSNVVSLFTLPQSTLIFTHGFE